MNRRRAHDSGPPGNADRQVSGPVVNSPAPFPADVDDGVPAPTFEAVSP